MRKETNLTLSLVLFSIALWKMSSVICCINYNNCNIGSNVCGMHSLKIKTTFGKHTLVEDIERTKVEYRPWRRHSQPKIKMEMAKRVALLRCRKVKKEGTESGTSSDSGTWVPAGEGFGYPPKIFTDPNYPQTSDREEVTEAHSCDEAESQMTMIAQMNLCQGRKHPFLIKSSLT